MLMRNKRGQVGKIFLGGVFGAVAFGVMILAVSLLAQVLDTNQDTLYDTAYLNVVNESHATNGTLTYAETRILDGFTNNIDNTTEVVWNVTDDVGVQLTRNTMYTLTKTGDFKIIPDVAGVASGGWNVNITYNYTSFVPTASYNISVSGQTGALSVGGLMPTMGIVFGILLVLSVLLIGFSAFVAGRIGKE